MSPSARLSFQADANVQPSLIHGVVRKYEMIDLRNWVGTIPDGMPDQEVLRFAARAERVLLTRDTKTMFREFSVFTSSSTSPGVVVIRNSSSYAEIIEGLYYLWETTKPEEIRNQIWWLP